MNQLVNPLVSVVLPTRKRPVMLRNAIASLLDNARWPDSVELLIRVDDDDPTDYGQLPVIRGPRHGYRGMHHYVNELFGRASARTVLSFNDDIRMLTPSWDAQLARVGDCFCVQFCRRDVKPESDCTLPAWPRKFLEVAGPIDSCFVDAWTSVLAERADVSVVRNDVVFHHDDGTRDEVTRDRGRIKDDIQEKTPAIAAAAAKVRMHLDACPWERFAKDVLG